MRTAIALSTIVIFLAVLCHSPCEADARSRRLPAPFFGACSARLMDTLHTICGRHGIGLLRNAYLMRRYRPRHLRFRRNGAMLRSSAPSRSGRSVPDFSAPPALSFEEARELIAGRPLSSILQIGQSMNNERKHKRRQRRQIAQECCENSCDIQVIRRRYCHFRYK